MKNILTVEIQNIRGIGHLKINMPLTPDVYVNMFHGANKGL